MSDAGWRPTGADPAAARVEFDPKPRPVEMGDPATDRPGAMRVEDWGRRLDPQARRVILLAEDPSWPRGPWCLISGRVAPSAVLTHEQVRDWPLTCELHVRVAMRDRALDGARGAGTAPALDGSDTEGDRPFR